MMLPAGWEGYQNNFLGLEEPWCHLDDAGVYVLPVPYEHTSSYVRDPIKVLPQSSERGTNSSSTTKHPVASPSVNGGIATVTLLDLNGKVDQQAVEAIEGFVASQSCIACLIYRMLGRIGVGRDAH